MTSDGTATYYDAPVIGGSPASPNEGIAVAHDGSVWVTSLGHNAIYRVDPKDGTFTKFDISTPGSQPGQITRGPGGALWFTMFAAQKIGRITTQGVITEYAQKLIGLHGIAADANDAIWYTAMDGLGRIDATTGRVRSFACQGRGGLTLGPDGHMWVLGDGEMSVVRASTEGAKARVRSAGS